MDELDVKIFRALLAESAVAPTYPEVSSSLRVIAENLGADDMTVRNRFKKFEESHVLATWQLVVNPTFFDYKMLDILVDVQPESAKKDMIRKVKLIHGVIGLVNYYGKLLKIILLYDGEESRSRTVELISRITNPENLIIFQRRLPESETRNLTRTDVAIINSLSNDARKPSTLVAKELGLSTKTVRSRIAKLRSEKTLFTLPDMNLGGVPGVIVVVLTYAYSNQKLKSSVDQAMRTHLDSCYLWGGFTDPDRGYIVFTTTTMLDTQRCMDWAKEQPGVASARVDIHIETIALPDKLRELERIAKPKLTR